MLGLRPSHHVLAEGLAVALVVVSVARVCSRGQVPRGGGDARYQRHSFCGHGAGLRGAVVLFCLPVLHIYFQRPRRGRASSTSARAWN